MADDGQPPLKKQRVDEEMKQEIVPFPFNSIQGPDDVLAPFPRGSSSSRDITVPVKANCFQINNFRPDIQFFQYDLQTTRIKDGQTGRTRDEDKLKLWCRLRRVHKELFKDVKLYWDKGGVMFTDRRLDLPDEGVVETIEMKKFSLEIALRRSRVEEVEMSAIQEFLNGNHNSNAQHALQALEVAMRSSLTRCNQWTGFKRNFFNMSQQPDKTQGGLIYKGLSHSFFPGEDSLLILQISPRPYFMRPRTWCVYYRKTLSESGKIMKSLNKKMHTPMHRRRQP